MMQFEICQFDKSVNQFKGDRKFSVNTVQQKSEMANFMDQF